MAFHPFRTFQKHRRKWLAAATILAMVTFIFAGSGLLSGGDFFSWASQALGGKGAHVTEPKQLRPALEKAMGSGEVSCVNVVLDPAAYRRGGQVSMAI